MKGLAPVRAWASMLLLLWGTTLTPSAHAQQVSLDLRLVLAVDCSYSVDAREFSLQMEGIAQAFRSKEVVDAIEQGSFGRIAVMVMQWSSAASQIVAVPWTVIEGRGGALRFAETVASTPRLTAEGGTSLAAALLFASELLEAQGGDALRRVVDISADGRNNVGGEVQSARDALVSRGITVNGLAVLNEVSTLRQYFSGNVVGGKDFFVVEARSYELYAEAIWRKLVREISGLPVS